MENKESKISRRKFVKIAGGITFLVTGYPLWARYKHKEGVETSLEKEISAWVQISTDGEVRIFNPVAEMGQGSMTALAVLVAEEMDADWSKVKIEYSPIDPKIYGRSWGGGRGGGTMMTVGSQAIRGYYENLRHAGAQARYVLLKAVSEKWKVPINDLSSANGYIKSKQLNKKLSFGEIASFKNIEIEIPEIPVDQWKKPEDFKLIGKYVERYDIPEKVNGNAVYSIDVRLPNMVYAFISRSPVHGAKPTLTNLNELKESAGFVDVVEFDHGIGVVAETVQQGFVLKRKMKINWSKGSTAETHTSAKAYSEYEKIADNPNENWKVINDKGDASKSLAQLKNTYEADYKNDYAYHAQMEPLNAVASISNDGTSADVWVGTQSAAGAKNTAVKALGIAPSNVTIHRCYLGGGFGRRSMSDYVHETCMIAGKIKRPTKLIWTREDDLRYGAFRPMSLQRLRAGLNDRGNLKVWQHSIIGTGGNLMTSGASTDYYTFEDQQIQMKSVDHGIRTKHWRAVGHGSTKFAIEAFINEIAYDQQKDPLDIRRELMRNHPRALNVLNRVAERSNWGSVTPEGRARGIAFAERSGSLVGGVCEISVNSNSGLIKVHKIWAVLDAGIVVQPDNALAQTEGSIIFGISSALKESISIKNGEVQESNYHDYNVLRMTDVPDILDIDMITSNESPSGIGEAALPWVPGAIAGAFLKLTGKKMRHIPFTKERVLEVLGS